MSDRIMAKHPEGKQGVNIERTKYFQIKSAIVAQLKKRPEQKFRGLQAEIVKDLEGKFEGSIGWYFVAVKLDLEARKILRKVDDKSPQRLVLTAKGMK
jgi:hypothetical protein